MSGVKALRDTTRHDHNRVDAVFSKFDLSNPDSYTSFLTAHCLALPVLERIISSQQELPVVRNRMPLLASDMATMRQPMPDPLHFESCTSGGAQWGILYVVEGSRLGSTVLARRVGPGLPVGYLSAQHQAGEWHSIRQAIDEQAARFGSSWIADAITAAATCFGLFRRAAEEALVAKKG